MDKAQADKDESIAKPVRWFNWDMVMVFPNPDHPEYSDDNAFLDSTEDAAYIYKKCFKEIQRENQTEMKQERKLELDMVKDLIQDHIMRDDKVLNRGGGRFTVNEEDGKPVNTAINGENGENDMNVSLIHLNDETIEDNEAFLDSKVYLSDFSTLILNGIIYRLNKILGFETLLLLSK